VALLLAPSGVLRGRSFTPTLTASRSLKWGGEGARATNGHDIDMECADIIFGVLKPYARLLSVYPIPKSAVSTKASLKIVQSPVCSCSAVYTDSYYVNIVLTTVDRLYRSPVCI
jgi:hypothetical protein